MYSDDWNSCLTGSQINAWNFEDDITRIGSRAEDYLTGIWSADCRASESNSRRRANSNLDSSDPFRRFQTPPPGRTSPTPLSDLYSQSIYQAEVNSDSWQNPESCNQIEQIDEEDCCSPNMKDVDCMPLDMFSFAQQDAAYISQPSSETFNRSFAEETPSSLTESDTDYTPKLIAKDETERQPRRPLLSLSVGMSICGVGLVFGAQIMHNTAVVNPGKSLIIAGLIGLFVSVVLQTVNRFGRRRTA